MRAALQAAGNVLLEAQVEQAPERTDEETPDGTSLPPGILKADLHTEIQINGQSAPRVKVGPSQIAGHVTRWQNSGWNLTSRGKSKSGRKVIRSIPGKHFIEAAFDESAESAVDAFVSTLRDGLFGGEGTYADDNYGGENY